MLPTFGYKIVGHNQINIVIYINDHIDLLHISEICIKFRK